MSFASSLWVNGVGHLGVNRDGNGRWVGSGATTGTRLVFGTGRCFVLFSPRGYSRKYLDVYFARFVPHSLSYFSFSVKTDVWCLPLCPTTFTVSAISRVGT